jgi:hypothetical protein
VEVVTKTLETLVVPILESASFAYDIIEGGNTVKFDSNVPLHSIHWRIVDHTKPQVLSIEVVDLVSIAPDTPGILERVNTHTEDCFGKFSLVNMESLKYCLELPYTEESHLLNFSMPCFWLSTQWLLLTEAGYECQSSITGTKVCLKGSKRPSANLIRTLRRKRPWSDS